MSKRKHPLRKNGMKNTELMKIFATITAEIVTGLILTAGIKKLMQELTKEINET